MTLQVVHKPHPTPAQSPYRVVQQETGREVIWVNRFLDRECIRCLAETTLRSYALDLLHFLRWWVSVHQTDTVIAEAITESTLLEYVCVLDNQNETREPGTLFIEGEDKCLVDGG